MAPRLGGALNWPARRHWRQDKALYITQGRNLGHRTTKRIILNIVLEKPRTPQRSHLVLLPGSKNGESILVASKCLALGAATPFFCTVPNPQIRRHSAAKHLDIVLVVLRTLA